MHQKNTDEKVKSDKSQEQAEGMLKEDNQDSNWESLWAT